MTLRSKSLNLALEENKILSDEILKIRNNSAFNKFLNNKIDYTKQAIQPLTDDIPLQSLKVLHEHLCNNNQQIKTEAENEIIKTEEICNIPFPFVQTETLLYPDGSKVVTTFYPSNDKIPAKKVEYLSQSTITKTTTYDRSGKEKTLERQMLNQDNSSIVELIDFKFNRKTIKRFNAKKIAVLVENYVNDKLTFKLECDDYGNLKKEKLFTIQMVLIQRENTVYWEHWFL